MKSTRQIGFVSKTLMVALAAGTLIFAGAPKAHAQRWSVGVQIGQPGYVYDRDDYRRSDYRDREAWERQQAYLQHERWEQQREAYARQQAYYQHERWEAEQREAYARQQAYLRHERGERYGRHHDDDDEDR